MEQHFDFGAKNYWVKDYDSRKCEAKLKALAHFVTNIDGLDIHFIHARSKNPDALPMIVTHGWPGSIIEQMKAIRSSDFVFPGAGANRALSKMALPMALLAYTVVMSLTFISQPVTIGRVIGMLLRFPQIALYTAFWITIVFIIMDFAQAKYVKNRPAKS